MDQITDHAAQARARLLEQLKQRTRVDALVNALASRTQDVEDMLWSLATERTIDTAVGSQLDDLGAIVGQPREGRADETYRVWIRARMLLNRCSGTVEELLALFLLLLTPIGGNTVEIDEYRVASLTLRILDEFTGDVDEFAAVLDRARAAGVRALLEWRESDEGETFQCYGSAFTAIAALAANATAGDTSIQVSTTSGFDPAGGRCLIDPGSSSAETAVYTVVDATHLGIPAGVVFNHTAPVSIALAPAGGFGDETDATVGGQMADAVDATA